MRTALTSFLRVEFFDAGSVISTDGIHFTEQNNSVLGVALAAQVRQILADDHAPATRSS